MNTKKIAGTGILLALTVVLTLISNYIQIGTISLNLSLIPIALAGILFGPLSGFIAGLVNGAMVLTAPSTAAFFAVSVGGTVVICLFKTSLAGLISALIYKAIRNEHVSIIVSSLLVPFLNTLLFVLGALIFYRNTFGELISLFVTLNFLIEFLVTIALTYSIERIVKYFTHKKDFNPDNKTIKKYDFYIFDFDGTLVDSFPGLYKIFSSAYSSVGITITESDAIILSRMSLKKGYKWKKGPKDKESFSRFLSVIRKEVDSKESVNDIYLYDDTIKTLNFLKDNGAYLAISTSNSKEHVVDTLIHLGIDPNLFVSIVGNKEVKHHKPHPEPVLKAIELSGLNINKKNIVYVGDGLNDVKAGKRAKVDTLLMERFSEYPKTNYTKIHDLIELSHY